MLIFLHTLYTYTYFSNHIFKSIRGNLSSEVENWIYVMLIWSFTSMQFSILSNTIPVNCLNWLCKITSLLDMKLQSLVLGEMGFLKANDSKYVLFFKYLFLGGVNIECVLRTISFSTNFNYMCLELSFSSYHCAKIKPQFCSMWMYLDVD